MTARIEGLLMHQQGQCLLCDEALFEAWERMTYSGVRLPVLMEFVTPKYVYWDQTEWVIHATC